MNENSYGPDEVITRKTDPETFNKFYVVSRGLVDIYIENENINQFEENVKFYERLRAGKIFGARDLFDK